jgi:gluconokinase
VTEPSPTPPAPPKALPIVVVAGVSGAGKTTVGGLAAERLGVPFADADRFHSDAARAKMRSGMSLTDADRAPWLRRLARVLAEWRQRGSGGVLACSALTPAYRSVLLGAAPSAQFVHLRVHPHVLAERIASREGHFFPPHLLASQLATLDTQDVPEVDAGAGSPDEVAQAVVRLVVR